MATFNKVDSVRVYHTLPDVITHVDVSAAGVRSDVRIPEVRVVMVPQTPS
jgi:hypothetical protein